MPPSIKPLLRLLLPFLLLALTVIAMGNVELVNSHYLALFTQLPYLLFAITLLLAHYFNRARFFAAATSMCAIFWLIQNHLQIALADIGTLYTYTAVSLLAPLGLLLLAALPERGLWNRHGILTLALTPLLACGAWLLYLLSDSAALLNILNCFSIKPWPGYVLSQAATGWVAMLISAGVLLLSHRDTEAEAALTASTLFIFLTLAFFDQPLISTLMFSAAALTLIISLLRSSFEMAYRDDLTGLLGRRALNEKLSSLGRSYSIAMLDIDHFKNFNDRHGHDVGDDVLKIVSRHIAEVSGGGIPYRYGGEEFCIIFPGKRLKPCTPHLEAVREAIGDHSIVLRDKTTRPKSSKAGANQRGKKKRQKSVSVTISIGLAEKTSAAKSSEQVLKMADKALYKAKQNGRNCLAD